MSCTFCRIVEGKTAARILFEDAETLAFFPMVPELDGHTLVIPKVHVCRFEDVPDKLVLAVMNTVQLLITHYQAVLPADGVNVLFASGSAAQQSVPHFHVHLLPRVAGDGVDAWPILPGVSTEADELQERLKITAHSDETP